MNDFEKALHAHNQKPMFCAVVRITHNGEIAHIVDVCGSGAQAQIGCDARNERFAKALHPYQCVAVHDFDVHGDYVETKELTVLKECRAESALALRRPSWLRKLVDQLDRWFVY